MPKSYQASFLLVIFFFFIDTATTEIYTLSLHDALPVSTTRDLPGMWRAAAVAAGALAAGRSEEHTSELQSRFEIVCRLLLAKKNTRTNISPSSSTNRRSTPCLDGCWGP